MDLKLNGKTALVTGSSTGIGRGIAEILAGEGVTVFVHGRNAARTEAVARAIRDAGGRAHIALGDLTSDEGAAEVVGAVRAETDSLDILVNNIGGTEASGGGVGDWFATKPEHWAGAMQQNLIGAVRMVHAFAPGMREQRWGRIVNISSAGATEAPPAVPDYCAAKAGVINMTVSLSKALARTGVTVNTVSPGCIRTEMLGRAMEKLAVARGWPDDYPSREARFMEMGMFACSTEHYGEAQDVGALVAFLASPRAAFVTGANYRIDGGQAQSVN